MHKSTNKYNKIQDKRHSRLITQQYNNKRDIQAIIDKSNRKIEKINNLSLGLISGYCRYVYDPNLLTKQYNYYYTNCDLCAAAINTLMPECLCNKRYISICLICQVVIKKQQERDTSLIMNNMITVKHLLMNMQLQDLYKDIITYYLGMLYRDNKKLLNKHYSQFYIY